MTLATHDLERQVAEAVTAPASARVLVVAHSPTVGATMLAEMQTDAAVRGSLAETTLSEALAQGEHVWQALDFVVFELGGDPASDLEAVRSLKAREDCALHCIAMARDTLTADLRTALTDAGVAEIIALPPRRDEQPKAPEEPLHAPVQQLDASTMLPPAPATQETAPTHMAPTAREPQGHLTVLLRARGGAGATTLAVNLAAAQADVTGAGRVALLDLDIQNGAVALAMDLPDSTEATALVTGETKLTTAFLDRALVRHTCGVDVLTAPDIFAPLDALTPAVVTELIAALKGRYDHIIVDMPQAVTEWSLPVLAAASQVIVITDTSLPSVKRTRRLIDLIGEEHMTLPVEVVVNQQQKPLRLSAALRECEALIGRPLRHWIPLDPKTARRASDLGIPLQISAKRSRMARAITTLAARVFAQKSCADAAPTERL